MPTFVFYRNRVSVLIYFRKCKVTLFFQTKVDRLQGADPTALENKIQQYYGTDDGEDAEAVAGHVSIILIELMHLIFYCFKFALNYFYVCLTNIFFRWILILSF